MARRKKCRYGKLKSPRGKRVCRRKPARGGKRRAKRSSSKKRCRFGKLKNPTGRRVCRRKPRRGGKGRSRRSGGRRVSRAAQEAAMWRAYRSGKL